MGLKYDDLKNFSPEAKRQIIEQLKEPPKVSKMHNEIDYRGNIRFQSKKEARRYDELMIMLRAGEIKDLRLQHDCTLQEAYTTPQGKRVRAIRYKADFTYYRRTAPDTYGYPHWVLVVEDAKGRRLETYKMKAKMFQEKYGFPITEV